MESRILEECGAGDFKFVNGAIARKGFIHRDGRRQLSPISKSDLNCSVFHR